MSNIRRTQSFAPMAQDDTSNEDGLTPLPRRLSKLSPELFRFNQRLANVEIADDTLPRGGASFSELPDLPRHSLTLPASVAGTSLRNNTMTQTPIQRLTGTASAANETLMEKAQNMTREQLLLETQEKLGSMQNAAQELIAQLEAFEQDKTPTNTNKGPAQTKQRFKRKLVELVIFVDVANKKAQQAGLEESALTPFAHRQMKQYWKTLEQDATNVANEKAGRRGDFSADEMLLAALQKISSLVETKVKRR